MPLLPSPIPHPLSYFDAPGWMCTTLEWVVGVDWPEGDEAAMRELADDWYAASSRMGPLLDEADDAVLAAVAAAGGPDGQVASAILRLWSQLGRAHGTGGEEAALAMVVDLLDDFGAQVDDGANQIEGVKIEFYVELGLLLIELIALAAAAAVTLGASMAGAAPAMYATRFAIQRLLRRAAKELLERAAKNGLKDRLKDRLGDAVKDRIRSKVVRHLGEQALEEGLQEGLTSLGVQAYQVSEGNRGGLNAGELALDTGLGALAGGVGGVTGLGRTRATTAFGRFGEHALRGASGEMLGEVTVGVVTGQGVSLQSLGMAATSATFGSAVGDTRVAVDGRLLGAELSLSAALDAHGQPGVTALSTAVSLGSFGDSGDAAPAALFAGPAGETAAAAIGLGGTGAAVDLTGDHASGPGVAFGGEIPGSTAAGHGPHLAGAPADPAGLFDGDAGSPEDRAPAIADLGHDRDHLGDRPAAPHAGLAADGVAVLDPATGTIPSAPGPAAAGPPTGAAAPPVGSLAGPAAATGGSVTGGFPPGFVSPVIPPSPSSGHPGGASGPARPGGVPPTIRVPQTGDLPQTGGVPQTHGVPPVAAAESADEVDVAAVAAAAVASLGGPNQGPVRPRAAEPGTGDRSAFVARVPESRAEREAYESHTAFGRTHAMRLRFDPRSSTLLNRLRRLLQDAFDAGPGAHDPGRAAYEQSLAPLEARLRTLQHGPIDGPRRYEIGDESFTEFQRLRYGEDERDRFRVADGAINEPDDRSRATGLDDPRPVETSRRYGLPGGHRRPLALHQQDVELVVERDADGRPRRFSDLFGEWPRRTNDGGPKADPTRAINCTDVVLSVIDTWLHGRPRVAAPRTVDRFTPDLLPLGGEPGGAARIEDAVGARFQQLMADHRTSSYDEAWQPRQEAFGTLESALSAQGHGAVAVLLLERPSGAAHAVTVHNQHGRIVYVDAQDNEHPVSTYRPGGAVRMDALLLSADALPVDLGLPPGHWSRPDTAVEDPGTSHVEASGHQRPSDVFATPTQVTTWDALAGGRLDTLVGELKARDDLSLDQKLRHLREELFPAVAPPPSPVGGDLDTKNLRVYEWQSGELFVHAAALMLDDTATIEIAYEPHQLFTQYRDDVSDPYLSHAGPVPEGMTRDLADKTVLWRALSGRSTDGVDPAELAADAIDLQVRPLRGALTMRERLITEFGVDPARVRLCHDDQPRHVHYATSKFRRAHLVALPQVRRDGRQARATMVAAMRGHGERGARRDARARALADLVRARHEPDGQPRGYALLWVRQSRVPMGAFMDTKPELLRQTVALLRESDPDRRILLIGDDLFDGRPELKAAFEAEGVLDGVDTETLRHFWSADRHGGQALGQGEQALFLHHLDSARDIVQIGMESGALEIAVALGVPTVYFQGREHVGDKGVRWQLYWDTWEYGDRRELLDEDGQPLLFPSGRPRTEFEAHTGPLRAPLATIHRVEFGPDLPDPEDRLTPPVAVHHPATVSAVSDRIAQLAGRELDGWPQRLGRDRALPDGWTPWDGTAWADSRYCADQADRWLRTVPGDIESAAHKWNAVQRALSGVLRPETAAAYREAGLHTDAAAGAATAARLSQAYAAEPDTRPRAVTEHVRQLLAETEPRRQACEELRLLQLDEQEVGSLRRAIEQAVTARAELRRMERDETVPAHGLPHGLDRPEEDMATDPDSGPGRARAVLDRAKAVRADGGAVIPQAVADLIDGAQVLPNGADGQPAVADFAAAALGRPVRLAEITGSTGAKGLSGAPVMLVQDEDGRNVGVVKAFPDAEEFARELSALQRLRTREFTWFGTPAALGIAATPQRHGVVVSALAPGKAIDDLITDVGRSTGAEWAPAFTQLEWSVVGVGAALADLHTSAEGSGRPVAREFLDRHVAVVRKWTGQVVDTMRTLPDRGWDLEELTRRVEQTIAEARDVRGWAALAHGDAHPGNFFWHPERGLTVIDLPMLHHAMDGDGNPIGAPERDLAYFEIKLTDFGMTLGLKPEELAHLRLAFRNGYRDAGGPDPDPRLMALFGVRGAIHVLKEVPYRMRNDRRYRRTSLSDLIEARLGLLREALKWNP
ncbi:toxin glutamine deamidase domain-containing protein [Catellatospora sichuanensis]|uniref:toxin glutamine deamidase domain-containing protein n=1 Tax=Catellatospora sichuanensis TaxID=1969805 RepID=UPI001182971E|nr:toxin glutamine deamidase domain-containing protein [Catellatospora sichuanensis]